MPSRTGQHWGTRDGVIWHNGGKAAKKAEQLDYYSQEKACDSLSSVIQSNVRSGATVVKLKM